jgi:hypothetical protein
MVEAPQPQFGLHDYIQRLGTMEVNGMKLHDLHNLRGTFSGEVLSSKGESYDLGQKEAGTFDNVAEHTAMSMLITDVLGEALKLDMTERGNLNLAAWEHDSGKKTERMWQRAIENAEEGGENSALLGDEASKLHKLGERKRMALSNVAAMEEWENTQAGIPQRANELMKSNIPATSEGPGKNVASQIMWFVDATLSGSTIVPISQRFDDLESDPRNGKRNIEFSDSYKGQYGGKSLYEVQRALGVKYEQEFAQKLGIEPTNLYTWLNNKVQERIQTQTMPILPQAA